MSIPDPANTSAVRVTLDLPLDPAEVAHAQERDALAHAYTRVAQETMDSLSDDIPSDLRARVKQVVWDSTMRGDTSTRVARAALGAAAPQLQAGRNGAVYQGVAYNYDASLAAGALTNAEADAHDLETSLNAEAQNVVGAVLRATQVPARPQGVSDADLAGIKQDLTAMLDAQPTPARRQEQALALVRQAGLDGNLALLHVLLGPAFDLTRQRLGLDVTALCAAAFQSRMQRVRERYAAGPSEAGDPRGDVYAPDAPPAAAFLSRQFDSETALGAAPMRAAQRIRHAVNYGRKRTGR